MPFSFRKRKNLVVLISLVFLQLILISLQVPLGERKSFLEKAIFAAFAPLQHGVEFVSGKMGNLWKDYLFLRDVRERNVKMNSEIFALEQENALLQYALKKLKNEEEIRSLLQEIRQNILPARVIGMDTGNVFKSVIINRGTLDGLKKHMVVVNRQGCLVGRIIEPISLKQAKVQLITDTDSGISVFTEKNRVPGIVNGDGRGQCQLKYIIATDEGVEEGEQVITSGFDGIMPPGIPVGSIVSITSDKSLFKKISVKPLFSISDLDQIAIITLDPNEFF